MHPIEIPRRYLDWVEARRGRRHIFERLDLARTALLVIDMQNGFLIPGYSPLEVPGLSAIVPNINRLARASREHGVLVVWTQQTYTEEWRSWARNFASPGMRDRIIAETVVGAHGFAIHESLEVAPGDLRVVKRRSSAFTPGASDLHERLVEAGRDTLIITGTLTNVCCEATARDAMLMNYDTVFVADANGAGATRSIPRPWSTCSSSSPTCGPPERWSGSSRRALPIPEPGPRRPHLRDRGQPCPHGPRRPSSRPRAGSPPYHGVLGRTVGVLQFPHGARESRNGTRCCERTRTLCGRRAGTVRRLGCRHPAVRLACALDRA